MRLIDADALNIRKYTRWFENVEDVRQVERMIREAPTITPQPNPPLTPDELREMGKDWVWIELLDPYYRMENGYYIKHEIEGLTRDRFQCGYPRIWVSGLPYSLYGDDWLAYRRRPEEGTA